MSTTLHMRCCAEGEVGDPTTGRCCFPDEDWVDSVRCEHTITLDRPLFDVSCLHLDAPQQDVKDECTDLLRMQFQRKPGQEKLIRIQAGRPGRYLYPLRVMLGLGADYNNPSPELSEVMKDIDQNISKSIFVFKSCFMRARPFRMCRELSPLFPRDDDYYPGHPSYPSGHATTVFAWAHLYKSKLSVDREHTGNLLLTFAESVAKNREWAGVHFASDTIAGESLGKQIADAILREGRLTDDEYRTLMPGWT